MSKRRKGSTPLYEAKHGSKHCRENKLCVECGGPLTGRQRRWCGQACVDAYLIRADRAFARQKVEARDLGVCAACGLDTKEIHEEIKVADKDAFECYLVWRNRQNPEGYMRDVSRPTKWAHLGYARCHGPWTSVGYSPGGTWAPDGGSRKRRRRKRHVEWGRGPLWDLVRTKRREKLIEIGQAAFLKWWWRGSFWDMDHVRPVEHGGGECGLENYQTLCLVCHCEKTARQNSQRAKGGLRKIERRPDERCEFTRTCRRPSLCDPCKRFRVRARGLLASKQIRRGHGGESVQEEGAGEGAGAGESGGLPGA